MPINELEQHPYLNYYQDFDDRVNGNYYQGIIIGSFPIYAVTDSVNPANNNIIAQRLNAAGSMRFFYGSRKSDLWKYVGLALQGSDPRKNQNHAFLNPNDGVQNCKNLLYKSKLLMSDALWRTNRVNVSSADSDLMVDSELEIINQERSVNFDLIKQLKINESVKSIFFTATGFTGKTPCGWFKDIFLNQINIENELLVGGRIWSAVATINFSKGDTRKYNLFFLPTPSTRGMQWTDNGRVLIFENFVQTEYPDFYNEINHIPVAHHSQIQKARLTELRAACVAKQYRQAIVHNNITYDGTNPVNN